jgi:hypothetical protein
MGKKQVAVSLRKPPPSDPDAFVSGGEKAEQPQSPAPAAPRVAEGPSVVTRVGARREVTVYLPSELARKLSVRCLELDRDVSNVVAEALAGVLAAPDVAPTNANANANARSGAWERARTLLVEAREEVRARLPWVVRFAS